MAQGAVSSVRMEVAPKNGTWLLISGRVTEMCSGGRPTGMVMRAQQLRTCGTNCPIRRVAIVIDLRQSTSCCDAYMPIAELHAERVAGCGANALAEGRPLSTLDVGSGISVSEKSAPRALVWWRFDVYPGKGERVQLLTGVSSENKSSIGCRGSCSCCA